MSKGTCIFLVFFTLSNFISPGLLPTLWIEIMFLARRLKSPILKTGFLYVIYVTDFYMEESVTLF